MTFDINVFKAYMKNFFSKWYVLLSILFNIIGSIALFYTPSLTVLVVVVLGLSIISIIYSGYLVYKGLFEIIPVEYRLAYLPPKKGKPELKISQIGGGKYTFGYRKLTDYQLHQSNLDKVVLPNLAGHFHFKVENIGYIPIDILTISGSINEFYENFSCAFYMSVDTALSTNENPLDFPIALDHEDETQIILYITVRPDNLRTDAQFAVELREMLQSEKTDSISVSIQFSDKSGNTFLVTEKFTFIRESILNLFIENWKSLNKNELLRLAGVN